MQKGLIIVFTGQGKGKSATALGIALRSSGHHMQVSMIQFMKNGVDRGEEIASGKLKPNFELLTMGKSLQNQQGNTLSLEQYCKTALDALSLARQRITSGFWDVVILDEINTSVHLGFLSINDVLALLKEKKEKLHVVLTGENAHPALISMADFVTELRDIKHPADFETQAQKGIDY